MPSFKIAALLLVATALAVDVTVNPSLNAQLETATQQLDRLALLSQDSQWTFDFNAQKSSTFSPGSVVNANAATFPAAVDNELTMVSIFLHPCTIHSPSNTRPQAMINLGPCAMLPPHLHPRASNYVVGIAGNVSTYMIEENGARVVSADLTPGKMTIFPRGSLHSMVNNGCTNAQLVSALSNTDQGTSNIVNGLSMFPADILEGAFGGPNQVPSFRKMPDVGYGAVAGSQACRQFCGIA
jgi:hypothetical protein